ncbi:MAG: type I restriction endonuclease subunit R [Firmicutes bacterium]|nr:type I restriction endonuclease subunit R [Bacillota bacterium]
MTSDTPKSNIVIAESNNNTVVAEYTPLPKKETSYQTEYQLEQDFLKRLQNLGYEYISNPSFAVLKNNLRVQMEKLNKKVLGDSGFSDREWKWFFDNVLANSTDGVQQKTERLQDINQYTVDRDNGDKVNVVLIDKYNIYNNSLQVFNQYKEDSTQHHARYDVTILVNGLPLVHIELKRRGVSIKEAFNQIARYSRDNFDGSNAIFDWVQVFVVSNGTETKYFSNTTKTQAIQENLDSGSQSTKLKRKTSHSFEFTSYWADARNQNIKYLEDFCETFLNKYTLLNILSKYCVFTVDKTLLVMRPYQIVACEGILHRIKLAYMQNWMGTIEAGGYVWHTTGSGKTLTSFKAAQLATALDYIDKTIFVVDRKDLDYQTIKEFEKFGGKDSVSGNVSTKILASQLDTMSSRIIVTTIQKLNRFVETNKSHSIYSKNIVLIFDECHRSQFGKMHSSITKVFKNYYLFGFTGTPIFVQNANPSNSLSRNNNGQIELVKTTQQVFGKCLHKYTIDNAIKDGNVLPFKIDCNDTIVFKDSGTDVKVSSIQKAETLQSPNRIKAIANYILDNFNAKTYRQDGTLYTHNTITNTIALAKNKFNTLAETKERKSIRGFNSILAVDSIKSAKLYYEAFKVLQQSKGTALKISTIFSYNPNESTEYLYLEEEFETEQLDQSSRDFLDSAIRDYNVLFGTNWDSSSDKFQSFYKDVSMRVKNKEIDILIVVNMFLTGFDATTLNTLWVDKNLRYHGLIQAFSRTNRILNSQKRFGNIVCFRKLEEQIKQACGMFGDKSDSKGTIVIRPFDDYYNGYVDQDGSHRLGYSQIVDMLLSYGLPLNTNSEIEDKEFIKLFGQFLRIENILKPFDEFEDKQILSARQRQDYQSEYLNLYDKYRSTKEQAVDIQDDLIFEIELIKQFNVNIDYILLMVEEYKSKNGSDRELALFNIKSVIDFRPELRSKKALILDFLSTVNNDTKVTQDFEQFVSKEQQKAVDELVANYNLKPNETKYLIKKCLVDGEVPISGTDISSVLPPMHPIKESNKYARIKSSVVQSLREFLDKFLM